MDPGIMQGLVTVFGGSGFVGGQVVRALAKRGLRVRVAVRRPNLAHRMRLAGDVGQIEIVQANVRDQASVARALEDAEAVVKLAAVFYENGSQRFQSIHVEGAGAVAKAAAARGITRFVQVSGIGADATSASAYIRSRGLGERAVREALPQAIIVRPSVVFGPEDKLFNRFAQLAVLAPALPLPGGGATRFAPVFVGDVAAAIANALIDPKAAGKTFELGGPNVYTYRELIELTLKEIQRNRPLAPLPWGIASLIGKVGEIQGRYTPIPPLLTADQVALLKSDNLPAAGAPGLKQLGVQPTAAEGIIPTYLYRYRKGGQFADAPVVVSGARL
jgi:NADH dehydrogenase